MNVSEALCRIDEIHSQLAKGEIFRGFSPLAIALSGVAGLSAALLQPLVVEAGDPMAFLRYWLVAGFSCGLIGGSGTLSSYFANSDESYRRRTRTVVGQFIPSLLAGAIAAIALSRRDAAAIGVPLLPGVWSLFFGLGIIAARPYLPRGTALVAVWFLGAGAFLLTAGRADVISPWSIGLPFGLGQLGMAWALRGAQREIDEDTA